MRGIRRRFRRYFSAMSLLIATVSHAATELQGTAPVDLLRYLSGGGEFYQDLPPDFPTFEMPEGLNVIGSHDLDSLQRVLLRSALPGLDAQTAVTDALIEEGWSPLASSPESRNYGFIVPGSTGFTPVTLCHNEFGNLEVRGEDGVENRVYLRRFGYNRANTDPECAAQNQARLYGRPSPDTSGRNIYQYVPTLSASNEVEVYPMPVMGIRGVLGSPNQHESSVFIDPRDRPLGAINRHYDEQLETQGWRADARWSADFLAGGNWTRTVEGGMRLFLTLTLTKTAPNEVEVKLSMVELE